MSSLWASASLSGRNLRIWKEWLPVTPSKRGQPERVWPLGGLPRTQTVALPEDTPSLFLYPEEASLSPSGSHDSIRLGRPPPAPQGSPWPRTGSTGCQA